MRNVVEVVREIEDDDTRRLAILVALVSARIADVRAALILGIACLAGLLLWIALLLSTP